MVNCAAPPAVKDNTSSALKNKPVFVSPVLVIEGAEAEPSGIESILLNVAAPVNVDVSSTVSISVLTVPSKKASLNSAVLLVSWCHYLHQTLL